MYLNRFLGPRKPGDVSFSGSNSCDHSETEMPYEREPDFRG